MHCLGWYFNDPCKTERGKKTDRKKMPGVKKSGEDHVEPSDLDGSENRWSRVSEKSSVIPLKRKASERVNATDVFLFHLGINPFCKKKRWQKTNS